MIYLLETASSKQTEFHYWGIGIVHKPPHVHETFCPAPLPMLGLFLEYGAYTCFVHVVTATESSYLQLLFWEENIVSMESAISFASDSLSALFSVIISEPQGEQLWFIDIPCRTMHSMAFYSPHIDQLWIYVKSLSTAKETTLMRTENWANLYNLYHKSVGVGSVLCTHTCEK